MLPAFLEKYREDIERYKKDYVKIKATPIEDGTSMSITQSKFLGLPYLPLDFAYPKDQEGKPMILLAQINFSEVPPLENYPTDGILQLFVSGANWYDMKDYKILYHTDTTLQHQTEFSFLEKALYEESPINVPHTLTFISETEFGDIVDHRFDLTIDGLDFFDYSETLSEKDQTELYAFFSSAGHKIGGYAFFTQNDIRDCEKDKRNDLLVFQIDTDEKIMFGDSGVANVFISPENLKNRNFESAYFNWDCC